MVHRHICVSEVKLDALIVPVPRPGRARAFPETGRAGMRSAPPHGPIRLQSGTQLGAGCAMLTERVSDQIVCQCLRQPAQWFASYSYIRTLVRPSGSVRIPLLELLDVTVFIWCHGERGLCWDHPVPSSELPLRAVRTGVVDFLCAVRHGLTSTLSLNSPHHI